MTKTMVVWTALVVAAMAGQASAAGQTFDKYVSSIGTAPADAAKRLETCQVLVLPNGEARTPCKISAADLAGTDKDVTLKATHVTKKTFPKSVLAWTEADVEVRAAKKVVGTYHVFELTSDEPGGGLLLQYWAKLVKDADAVTLAKSGKTATPKLTAGATKTSLQGQEQADRDQGVEQVESALTSSGDIKEQLAQDAKNGAIIIGSAPNQRFTGAGGAKTLTAWKMDLAWSGKPMTGGTALVQWGYTQAAGKSTDKDKTAITYGALYVQVQRMTGGGSPAPSSALYIFSVPQ